MFRTLLVLTAIALHLTAHGAEPSAKSASRKTSGKALASLGSYMPKVKRALAKQWGTSVTPRMAEFSQGDVNVRFAIDSEGRVTDCTVSANSSNESFGKFCEQFVRGIQFDKPPSSLLTNGRLEIPFTFTIL